MLLNLKASTWEKLKHLAKTKDKSAASCASKIIDEYVGENVETKYELKEEKQNNV